MDVTKLLNELLMVSDVEVVISLLPEMVITGEQLPRNSLFQRFQSIGECLPLWFAQQKVDVLRHNHVSIDAKSKLPPDALQCSCEHSAARVCRQKGTAVITAERHEMALPGLLVTL